MRRNLINPIITYFQTRRLLKLAVVVAASMVAVEMARRDRIVEDPNKTPDDIPDVDYSEIASDAVTLVRALKSEVKADSDFDRKFNNKLNNNEKSQN